MSWRLDKGYDTLFSVYLYNTRNNSLSDTKRQMRKFYANICNWSGKFSKCSPDVKCTLCKSFRSTM